MAGLMPGRRIAEALVSLAVIVFVTAALLEALVASSFRWPHASLLPKPLLRYLYVRLDRNTIQVMPECARYDPGLTYTLKPGRCTFGNREFSNEYRVNAVGLRDDDASLQAPETIALGDSVTMGWGVHQDEAYPKVLQQLTGNRTLNAGISSYGTARETRLLERLDRSALKNLIIQYSGNDFDENDAFVSAPTFKILTEAEYLRTVELNRRELAYFPGKYALNLLVQFRSAVIGAATRGNPLVGPAMHADRFVGVLERCGLDLKGVRVTVLTLESGFADALRERARSSRLLWVNSLDVVDMSQLASVEGAYYTLDDHPTAAGHAAIAQALASSMAQRR